MDGAQFLTQLIIFFSLFFTLNNIVFAKFTVLCTNWKCFNTDIYSIFSIRERSEVAPMLASRMQVGPLTLYMVVLSGRDNTVIIPMLMNNFVCLPDG